MGGQEALVYEIRTITLHAPHNVLKEPSKISGFIESRTSMMWESADKVKESIDLRTGMVRITLPDPPQDRVFDIIDGTGIRDEDDAYIVSIGNIPVYHPMLQDIVESAVDKGLFVSILNRPPVEEAAVNFSKLVHYLAGKDINYPTRIGFNVYGRPVYTPYYPLSSSPGDTELFSIALTYPNHMKGMLERGNVKQVEKEFTSIIGKVEESARIIRDTTGIEYLGVDLSLSPWMEESVARLVEIVSGRIIGEPGSAYGVYVLNTLINNAAGKTLSTGFNEVQLPVAEDNVLKERGVQGRLKARDLARLTGVCLAGLDLAVVPSDISRVRDLVLEVFSYSLTKNRPLGVRIVPVDLEPGSSVEFEKFGKTPVIPV
jgi:uncharacterized protein (UPF0210 family)